MLYEKIISPSGRVTYKEYNPSNEGFDNMEVEVAEIVSIMSTLIISLTKLMSDQLEPSDILHRKIRNVGNELIELARVGFIKPQGLMVDIGVEAWNAAIKAIQEGMLRVRQ